MKDFLRGYFHYNKRERNGFVVLAFLCLFAFLLPIAYRYWHTSPKTNFSQFQKEIQDFAELQKAKVPKQNKRSIDPSAVTLFDFDPNTASADELALLGFPKRVVNTLINFRNKGGRFKTPQDLKKIYGLSEEDYRRLENFIHISEDGAPVNEKNTKEEALPTALPELFKFDPNTASEADLMKLGFPERAANNLLKFRAKGGLIRVPEDLARIYGITEAYFTTLFPYIEIQAPAEAPVAYETQNPTRLQTTEKIRIDINAASAEEWQKLKGLGPKLSTRIVKFRDRLGGFYEVQQVADTYGLPDSVFQSIRSSLQLATPHQKININAATKETLAAHPYLNKKQAELIVNYRLQHDSFRGEADLRKMIGLPDEIKDKILPYLSFD